MGHKDIEKTLIKRIEKAKTIAELEKIKGYYKPEAAQFAIINFKDRTLLLKFNTDKIKLTVHPKSTCSRETLFTYFYTEE